MLKKALMEKNEWQKLVYLSLSYDSAGRKTEVWLVSKNIDWVNRETNIVRGKGGKTFTLPFSKETEIYIKKWLEVRGEDDCDKLFVMKTAEGKVRPISKQTLNNYCEYFSELYKELTGKEVNIYPHCFKANRLNSLYREDKLSLEVIQQFGHHSSSQTTLNNYIEHRQDDVNNRVFKDDKDNDDKESR
jgi:integrase